MLAKQSSIRVALALVALITILVWYSSGSLSSPHRVSSFADYGRKSGLLGDIGNATWGFEDILVVSLPTRTDRRDGMQLQAALSEVRIKFVDAIIGKTIPDNAIPKTTQHDRMGDASIGSWRAHMNAIHEVVARNLSSALILEDDVDWDIRIRQQLHDFALSAQALTQPLTGSSHTYADPTYPHPAEGAPGAVPDLMFGSLPQTIPPKMSPYGDDWDLLWLGHCGMRFVSPENPVAPKARVIHLNDETCPEKRYLWSITGPFKLVDDYPQHTRAVHHSEEGVCSLGYAISQRGARKLLYELGTKDLRDGFDILLRFFCNGGGGRKPHMCLSLSPGLFHHHRAAGPLAAQSDIGDHGDGFRDQALTDMVRWSVRLNAETLLDGGTVFHDQYPNSDDA
ncbi:uncharacterized protein B0I36DRAFT_127084 [Microdochium trichocladiopsis]|uniref:Glycosyl transferase family 25 domain-containing protein n=1 Tax=Microdochium trichocladiopsis TaxID=1682393 RepID=A0A9P9BSK8_9PEZI|nr:uncharacterized protein B0I36DRAFT_127084 [Microdochium trichocladiopsis]KAH7028946.1 hypothetical protein B0I36DRAFT_127084 [Microdochium trichocladiopsis]